MSLFFSWTGWYLSLDPWNKFLLISVSNTGQVQKKMRWGIYETWNLKGELALANESYVCFLILFSDPALDI